MLQDIYEVPGLKGEIKDWNMNVFGRIDSSRNMLSREVEAWEREEEKKVFNSRQGVGKAAKRLLAIYGSLTEWRKCLGGRNSELYG